MNRRVKVLPNWLLVWFINEKQTETKNVDSNYNVKIQTVMKKQTHYYFLHLIIRDDDHHKMNIDLLKMEISSRIDTAFLTTCPVKPRF